MKSPCLICLGAILLIASCKSETRDKKTTNSNKEKIDTVSNKFEILSNDSLSVLLKRAKKFAEEYNPISNSELGIALLTNVPDSIVYSFKQLRVRGNKEHVKYLVLVLVKVYRTHLKCCHQGYELRNKPYSLGIDSISDPLLYEFNKVSKIFDPVNRIEFINSGFWQTWLENNKHLLEYDKLRKEYQEVEKIGDGILKEPNKYY